MHMVDTAYVIITMCIRYKEFDLKESHAKVINTNKQSVKTMANSL